MAFQYHDINKYEAQSDELFLLDANIWIFYLNQDKPRHFQKPYLRFLNKLLQQPEDPIILLPAAVLSEVVNKLLKGKLFDQFMQSAKGRTALNATPVDEKDCFKRIYRPHPQYHKDRTIIYQSIFSYSSNLRLISDDFHEIKLDDLITAMTDLDFTDWLIYDLAKLDKATIVTDDGDFMVENHPVVTNNSYLLQLMGA